MKSKSASRKSENSTNAQHETQRTFNSAFCMKKVKITKKNHKWEGEAWACQKRRKSNSFHNQDILKQGYVEFILRKCKKKKKEKKRAK